MPPFFAVCAMKCLAVNALGPYPGSPYSTPTSVAPSLSLGRVGEGRDKTGSYFYVGGGPYLIKGGAYQTNLGPQAPNLPKKNSKKTSRTLKQGEPKKWAYPSLRLGAMLLRVE